MSKSKLLAINVGLILVVIAIFEVGLRYYIQYNPSFYTGLNKSNSCIEYPYGTYCSNSHGYPDEEFDLQSQRPRIGYFGDSVCFGVGTDQSQRATTLLKHAYGDFEHWNFCEVGHDVMSGEGLSSILNETDQFKLSHLVYFMNLNDIAPTVAEADTTTTEESQSVIVMVKEVIKPIDHLLRGRSYLYSHIRNLVKQRLTVAGYEASGYQAIEMFPDEHNEALAQFAEHINEAAKQLSDRNVKFTLIMLPYEMQISAHAAATYQKAGIRWEPEFLGGRTQEMIAAELAKDITWFDAASAFENAPAGMVGDYFVYNKGDKLDWNHPNGEGHRLIAEFLIDKGIF